ANHALPRVRTLEVGPVILPLGIGNFRRNRESRDHFISYVGSSCESLAAIISCLCIEGRLVGCLECRAAPDRPIAAPGAVEAADRTNGTNHIAIAIGLRDVFILVGLVAAHRPDRETVRNVHVGANLASPLFFASFIGGTPTDLPPPAF